MDDAFDPAVMSFDRHLNDATDVDMNILVHKPPEMHPEDAVNSDLRKDP